MLRKKITVLKQYNDLRIIRDYFLNFLYLIGNRHVNYYEERFQCIFAASGCKGQLLLGLFSMRKSILPSVTSRVYKRGQRTRGRTTERERKKDSSCSRLDFQKDCLVGLFLLCLHEQ